MRKKRSGPGHEAGAGQDSPQCRLAALLLQHEGPPTLERLLQVRPGAETQKDAAWQAQRGVSRQGAQVLAREQRETHERTRSRVLPDNARSRNRASCATVGGGQVATPRGGERVLSAMPRACNWSALFCSAAARALINRRSESSSPTWCVSFAFSASRRPWAAECNAQGAEVKIQLSTSLCAGARPDGGASAHQHGSLQGVGVVVHLARHQLQVCLPGEGGVFVPLPSRGSPA